MKQMPYDPNYRADQDFIGYSTEPEPEPIQPPQEPEPVIAPKQPPVKPPYEEEPPKLPKEPSESRPGPTETYTPPLEAQSFIPESTGPISIPGGNVAAPPPVGTPESQTGHDTEMTPWEVTPEQTVQGQLQTLYDRDSPFMELARERARRSALASGGQNSAMAEGFGELAAMDTAFKVAFQDAQIYARSGEFNAAMSNQFSLAEQRFMHNAMLSDQAYQQAANLQTQRIQAQFEAIRMDFAGRSQLMDRELSQWLAKAAQQHQYALQLEDVSWRHNMNLNGMVQLTNFYTNVVSQAMQHANREGLTPEQSAAAMREAMMWADTQFTAAQAWWGAWAAGGPPLVGGGGDAWYDWSNYTPTYPGSNTGAGGIGGEGGGRGQPR